MLSRQKRVALLTSLLLFLWIAPYVIHSGFEGWPTVTVDSNDVEYGPEEEHTPAVGESWLSGWKYRKRIHINAISGAGLGYQIKFLVERTTGTDNDYNVHVSTKCQTDYGDIRWTSSGGGSLENHWRKEGYTSSSAWFWVKVSTSLSTSSTDLYIYYGTQGTTSSASSISNTFLVGDEFSDSSTSGWSTSVPQGSISEDSDDMHIYSGTNGDWWGGAVHNAPIAYRSWAGSGYAAVWKLNTYTVNYNTHSGVMFYSSRDNVYLLGSYRAGGSIYVQLEKIISDVGYTNIASSSGTYYYFQLRQVSSTEYYDYYSADTSPQYTMANLYSNTEIAASYVGMFAKEWSTSTVTALFDYFFVRKYTTSESSAMFGSWYGEETAVPVNDATPTCDTDDGDNINARYRYYTYDVSVTHKAGYAAMDYVELYCITDGAANYWSVRFDEDTNSFTEQTNPTYIQLDAGSSTYSKSGVNLDVHFKVKIEWAHGEHMDYDLKQYARDYWGSTDTDSYTSINFDYIATFYAEPALLKLTDGSGTTTRGDYDTVGGIDAEGYIQYYGSSAKYPPASEVDVWVTCPDTTDPDWELTYNDGTGYISGAVDSDDVVGQDTYTFKVVQQGAGSGGTDMFYTPYTRTYIADRVEVYSFSPDDNRIDINTQCNTIVWMRYDYDDVYCSTGTWTMESESLTLDSGYFYIRLTKSTVQGITFDGPLVGADTTHGVSKTYFNTGGYTQIWDRVQVQSYTPSDARDDINDDITLDVLLYYDYDDSFVTDGTVTMNGITASYQGSGVWRITRNSATVTSETYNSVAVSGNTEGITVVDQNGQSQTIIWDRVQVSTCSASDNRDDINDNVDIDFTLIYDYDDTAVTDGSVTINGFTAAHQGSGVWRITRTSATVTSVTYNTVTASGNTYGITEVDMNGQSTTVIWDRIQVQSYTPSDNRDDINDDITLDVLLWYDYDDTLLTTGTVTINGVSATHQGSGVWRITRNQATPQSETYNTVAVSGNTYDITEVDQNGKSQTIIWDRVQCTGISVTDTRTSTGTSINIDYTLIYDYDDTQYTDNGYAIVTIEGYSASHVGSGVWRITKSYSSVLAETYNEFTVTGGWYGLTEVDQNGQSETVIWDRVIITLFEFDDYRVNVDANAEARAYGILEYDSHALGSGDSISVNGTALTWDAGNSWFDYSFSQSTVGRWVFNVTAVNEATYGITTFVFYDSARSDQGSTYIDLNCATSSQDWSMAGWFKFSADSWTHYAVVWGSYKYDAAGSWGFLFGYRNSGNGDGDLHFYAMYNNSVSTNSVFLSPYVYSMDEWYFAGFRGNSTGYCWLDVYDSSGTIVATSAMQASDFVAWRIGDDLDFYTWHYGGTSDDVFSSDSLHYYERVLSSEEVYGLAFSQEPSSSSLEGWWEFNGDLTDSSGQGHTGEIVGSGNVDDHMGSLVWVVWDRVQVQTTTVTDSRVNINDNPEIRVTLCLDYDNHYLDGSDSVTLDDTAMTWDSTNSWFDLSRTKATVGLWNYFVNSTTHTLFSITALDLNSQSQNVIWDQIEVYWHGASDWRSNVDENEWALFRLRLKYDNHLLDTSGSDTCYINGSSAVWYVAGAYWYLAQNMDYVVRFNYVVTSASEGTYGITSLDTASATSEATFLIWDAILVTMWVDDARENIGSATKVTAWLTHAYDGENVTSGTVTINATSATYQSGGEWAIWPNYGVVTQKAYIVAAVSSQYAITVIGEMDFDGVADRVCVPYHQDLTFTGDGFSFGGWLYYDGDSDGGYFISKPWNSNGQYNYRIQITSSGHIYILTGGYTGDSFATSQYLDSGKWNHVFVVYNSSQGIAVYFNGLLVNSKFHTITDWNPADGNTSKDLVIMTLYPYDHEWAGISSFSLEGSAAEVRVYRRELSAFEVLELYQGFEISTSNLELRLYQSDVVAPSHVWYDSSGNARDGVMRNQDSYGPLTVNNTVSQHVPTRPIWDRVQVTNLDYGGDSRVDKGTTINFDFTLVYDFDDRFVTDGTVTINTQSCTHQGSGVWRYTSNGGDAVGDFTADTIAVSGNREAITVVDQNGKTVTMIWDQIEVYYEHELDPRCDVGSQNYPRFRLRLKYDYHLVDQTGYDLVWINSSSAAWSSGGLFWYKFYTMESVGSWNFRVTSASEYTYGITSFDTDSATTFDNDIIWDRVQLTVVRNYGWSFIDNNVTLSATGIFEYDSTAWSGTWQSNGTSPSAGTHYPYESTYGYYGYKVASITDPSYDLTVFTTNEVQVIWDTVTAQGSITKYWVQYSVTQVNLIWGVASTWKVQVNDTWLTNIYMLTGYSNGSSPQSSGGIYGTGSFGGMSLGFYTPAWWYLDLTVNCSVTIGARSFDFLIWEEVLAVDILHSIHIEDSLIFLSDDYVTFGIQTNWNNGTFYVWDNVTGTPVYQGGSLEGWYQIPKSTVVGTHVLIVLVNGSQGTVNPASQIATGTSNDQWEYLTFRYTVNPILIELSIYSISESSTKVLVSGICNLAVNYYVWVSDVYQGTGSISASVSFSVTVTKSLATAGSFLYGIKFNCSSDSEWFNGTYEVPASDVFGIDVWDCDFDDVYINIYCTTNWRNSTLYIYDNGVYKAYSPESEVVQYRKDSTEGEHVLSIKVDAGITYIWKNVTYSIAVLVEEMKISVLQWDTGSPDSVSGMIQTNWNNATITLTNPSGTTLASGVEGGTGYGVAFNFRKVQTSGTIHLVTVTITSGSSTMTLTLGYSWVDPSAGGDSTDPRALALIIDNSTRDAVNEALADKVVVPPAVFGGAVGLIVLLITIVISQAAWHWRKGVKRKKASELGRIAGFL